MAVFRGGHHHLHFTDPFFEWCYIGITCRFQNDSMGKYMEGKIVLF